MGEAGRTTKEIDDLVFSQVAAGAVKDNQSWPGLSANEINEKLDGTIGPERVVDMLIRIGPYGDGFGRRPDGLTLAKIKAAPHGIDLGPLEPRLHEIVNTSSGKVELAPETIM